MQGIELQNEADQGPVYGIRVSVSLQHPPLPLPKDLQSTPLPGAHFNRFLRTYIIWLSVNDIHLVGFFRQRALKL